MMRYWDSQEMKERNAALVQARDEGVSYRDLARLFGISVNRCNQIYRKEMRKRARRAAWQKERDELGLGVRIWGSPLGPRARCCLDRFGAATFEDIASIPEQQLPHKILSTPNTGRRTYNEIADFMESEFGHHMPRESTNIHA